MLMWRHFLELRSVPEYLLELFNVSENGHGNRILVVESSGRWDWCPCHTVWDIYGRLYASDAHSLRKKNSIKGYCS